MHVTLKLYASLQHYLPAEAERNQLTVEVSEGTTVRALLDRYHVPPEACHLVLLNGVFQAPAKRSITTLKGGDAVAAWPPIAGG